MNVTWNSKGGAPDPPPLAAIHWPLIALRLAAMIICLLAGLVAMVLLRWVERPVFGLHRPLSPYVSMIFFQTCLVIIGLRVEVYGDIMRQRGAIVANHASWLDIFVLNSRKPIYFVSKSEVGGWPGIGALARLVGTLFITRDPKQAKSHLTLFEERLLAGHKLLFFPEGTSTDGLRVLPFKTTLFQSFFNKELHDEMHIQPVTVCYTAPKGRDPRFYGWWGDMDFGGHFLRVLAPLCQGCVKITYHPPVKVADYADRKSLARELETRVRGAMPQGRQLAG